MLVLFKKLWQDTSIEYSNKPLKAVQKFNPINQLNKEQDIL